MESRRNRSPPQTWFQWYSKSKSSPHSTIESCFPVWIESQSFSEGCRPIQQRQDESFQKDQSHSVCRGQCRTSCLLDRDAWGTCWPLTRSRGRRRCRGRRRRRRPATSPSPPPPCPPAQGTFLVTSRFFLRFHPSGKFRERLRLGGRQSVRRGERRRQRARKACEGAQDWDGRLWLGLGQRTWWSGSGRSRRRSCRWCRLAPQSSWTGWARRRAGFGFQDQDSQQTRQALLLYQYCSFFLHCSKHLWPTLPPTFGRKTFKHIGERVKVLYIAAILVRPAIPNDDEKTWPSTTNQTLERTATGQQMPAVENNSDR